MHPGGGAGTLPVVVLKTGTCPLCSAENTSLVQQPPPAPPDNACCSECYRRRRRCHPAVRPRPITRYLSGVKITARSSAERFSRPANTALQLPLTEAVSGAQDGKGAGGVQTFTGNRERKTFLDKNGIQVTPNALVPVSSGPPTC